MTTRLSNEARTEIIDSVMKATTYATKSDKLEQTLKKRAYDFVKTQQPAGWPKLIKGHPQEWFRQQQTLDIDREANPMALLMNKNNYYALSKISFDDPISVALHIDESEVFEASIEDLRVEAAALADWHTETRGTLASFLKSCNTVEKVLERMPELAPHVPAASKAYPLVAPSNALAMLTKMGFDQTVKK